MIFILYLTIHIIFQHQIIKGPIDIASLGKAEETNKFCLHSFYLLIISHLDIPFMTPSYIQHLSIPMHNIIVKQNPNMHLSLKNQR